MREIVYLIDRSMYFVVVEVNITGINIGDKASRMHQTSV